ncbi:ABC transporter substrate-binding protein [Kribbella sp. NPDC050820]|uniref:ABC transporter substrate-binding protein n=1 Tax=Kribbella sp. NPDC050820 TaxID=3155408 RepID=UPI0033C75E57
MRAILRSRLRRALVGAIAAIVVTGLVACGTDDNTESGGQDELTIGIGGQPLLVYLPTTLAQQLGYYADEGLTVKIEDLQGGSKALKALQGGSVDVVSGYYDHTIQMQALRRDVKAFVNILRYPSLVLAVSPKARRKITSIKDLKGANVGVTAPGSSTDFFLKFLLVKNGMKADDAVVQGIGGGSTAVAAMETGKVDAAVMIDPAFSVVEKRAGTVQILSDTRTAAGVQQDFGVSTYPASVLYSTEEWVTKNPETARKLARAILRTLEWMRQHSATEIAAKMPEEFASGDVAVYQQSIEKALPAFSTDGKIRADGADAVYNVLKQFDPEVAAAKIVVAKSYTNDYVSVP